MEFLLNRGPKPGAAKAAGQGGDELVKTSDTDHFMQDVIEASMQVPVIVDFWATWCGPCKTLGPMLESAVRAAKGAVKMVKIDVDQNPELAEQLRVQTVPMVYAFDKGRPVDAFSGALPESQIKAFINRLTGGAGELDEAMDHAKALLADGDAASAVQIYQQVLAADHANPVAMGGYLRCLLALGEGEKVAAMLPRLPAEIAKHPDVVSVRTALELASQGGQAGPAAELRRAVEQNPDDHQARFDLAMALFAANDRDAAVDELLEIIRRDRTWNDDGARKQLLKLFEAIGLMDPLTVSARKRLSSLMFR